MQASQYFPYRKFFSLNKGKVHIIVMPCLHSCMKFNEVLHSDIVYWVLNVKRRKFKFRCCAMSYKLLQICLLRQSSDFPNV